MMTLSSQNLNIESTHGGFDVCTDGDEKQKTNFAWGARALDHAARAPQLVTTM